jgi:hypothetical protein
MAEDPAGLRQATRRKALSPGARKKTPLLEEVVSTVQFEG